LSALKPSKLTVSPSRYRRRSCVMALLLPGWQKAGDSTRQKEGHAHEDRAQDEEPRIGQRSGEVRLQVIDQYRAYDRAIERAASADGHPDHRLNGIDRRELA